MTEPDRLQWFIDRIGKRVWRNKTSCKCEVCKRIYEQGLIISDERHAMYLDDVMEMYQSEGIALRYFDTRKEVIEFEGNLNN